jgi:uncharacterized protein (DUF3084 family)
VSRSRYIVYCTERALSNGDNSGQQPGQHADTATDNALARQVENLNAQLAHKDEVIEMKDERIWDLEGDIGWLRFEYSKKDAQLSQFLLPAAETKPVEKRSIWDCLKRKNK